MLRLCSRRWVLLILTLFTALGVSAQPPANELADHPSPYLAMHAEDPVHWKVWKPEVMKQARQSGRLVFVSVGYFSCHWCHVMHGESYKDRGIAKLLNADFIPVKVDRELHPALDAELTHFVQLTRGYAGWPLNVLITPDGHPLVGFTYLPRQNFARLLRSLAERWRVDSDRLEELADKAAATIEATRPPPSSEPLTYALAARYTRSFMTQAMGAADTESGGFGQDSKFPYAPQLAFMLELETQFENEEIGDFLRLTLENMHRQGLRDQLGGGFFRYTTDPKWQIPHFEKMLYDNALLAELFIRVAQHYGEPVFEDVARDTLDFLLRELRSPEGGFYSSLSAVDAAGVEGGYYLWSEPTLRELLSPQEMDIAALAWRLSGKPALEHGYLPVQAHSVEQVATQLDISAQEVEVALDSARLKLLEARAQRQLPVDSKVLASWNGLVLRALSAAAKLDDGERYAVAANALRNYIVSHLWDGSELVRARSDNGPIGTVTLEDYAFVSSGLLSWAEFREDAEDYALVAAMVEQAWLRFHSTAGWRVSEQVMLASEPREPVLADTIMPSPSAVLIDTTLRLNRRIRSPALQRFDTREALSAKSSALTSTPFSYPSQLALANRYLRR